MANSPLPLQPDSSTVFDPAKTEVKRVDQKPPDPGKAKPLFLELSSNRGWTLGLQPTRLYNSDILVGKKGLKVYTEMRRDDQVKAALALKKHAILSTGWRIVPPGKEQASSLHTEVADFVDHCFRHELDGDFDDDLKEVLTSLDYGFSVTEILYKKLSKGKYRGKIGVSKLATRLPQTFTFCVDEHDNLLPDGIEQFGKKLPSSRFLVHSSSKEFDNWYGRSDLHEAYQWWWFKSNTIKWWSIFMDRYGIPLAEGILKQGGSYAQGDVDKIQRVLENLQANTSFVHPDSIQVQFPAVGGAQGSTIFDYAITRADKGIAKAILIPSLLGVAEQGDVGSYSQSRTQFDVFILVVESIQRELSKFVVGSQLIKRLVDLNYRVDEYPQFEFLPFTETDKGQLINLFNQCIAAGTVQPRPEDEVHVRSMTSFPEVTLKQLEQEQAQTAQQDAAQRQAQAAAQTPAGGQSTPGVPPGQASPPVEPPPAGNPGLDPSMIPETEIDALIAEALAKKQPAKTFAQQDPGKPPLPYLGETDDPDPLPFDDTEDPDDQGGDLNAIIAALIEYEQTHGDPFDPENPSAFVVDDSGAENLTDTSPGYDPGGEVADETFADASPGLDPGDEEDAATNQLLRLPWDEELDPLIAEAQGKAYATLPLLKENEVISFGPEGKRGVWRTIKDRKIFIPVQTGESVPDAIRRVRKEWNWGELRGRKIQPHDIALAEIPWARSGEHVGEIAQDLGLDPGTQESLTPTAFRFKTPEGEWHPNRESLHNGIIDRELGKLQPNPVRDRMLAQGAKPRVLFVTGGISAGQNSVLSGPLKIGRSDIVQISPSEIQAQLPEFSQLGSGALAKAASIVTQAEAQAVAQKLFAKALIRRADMVVDMSLSHPDQAQALVQAAKQAGYTVYGSYVDSPPGEALARQAKRVEKKPYRFVPEMLIERSHVTARKTFDQLKEQLDGWAVYRTYRGTGAATPAPTLVAHGKQDKSNIFQETLWQDFRTRPTELALGEQGQPGWHLSGMPAQYAQEEIAR